MKTLIFSIVFLVSGFHHNHFINNTEISKTISLSKVKVIVVENGMPIADVIIKVSQNNIHLGETKTDDNGEATIICKYLSDDNKEVEINATKKGYQPVHIHGDLITSTTNFQFNIDKEGVKSSQSNDMNFKFQYEEIKASL